MHLRPPLSAALRALEGPAVFDGLRVAADTALGGARLLRAVDDGADWPRVLALLAPVDPPAEVRWSEAGVYNSSSRARIYPCDCH